MKKAIAPIMLLMITASLAFGENQFIAIQVLLSNINANGKAAFVEWRTEMADSTGDPFSEGSIFESRCLVFTRTPVDVIGEHSICKHFDQDGDTFNTQLEANESFEQSVNIISGTGRFRGVLAACRSKTIHSDGDVHIVRLKCSWSDLKEIGPDDS